MEIRHKDTGEVIDVSEEMFASQYEAQGYERVDGGDNLGDMTRDELNAHAESLGIADAANKATYPNKDALVQAIGDHQATNQEPAPNAPAAAEGFGEATDADVDKTGA